MVVVAAVVVVVVRSMVVRNPVAVMVLPSQALQQANTHSVTDDHPAPAMLILVVYV